MSLHPRLRQSCRRDQRGSADTRPATRVVQRPSSEVDALGGRPPLKGATEPLPGQNPELALNRLFLSGILAAEPVQDEGRDGSPVTLLLVAFPAPDARDGQERPETASCEVEVPDDVVRRHGKELRAGGSIFVTGQLSGGGGVIATEIHSGLPPEEEIDPADPHLP